MGRQDNSQGPRSGQAEAVKRLSGLETVTDFDYGFSLDDEEAWVGERHWS